MHQRDLAVFGGLSQTGTRLARSGFVDGAIRPRGLELADLAEQLLFDSACTWSMGGEGALAEVAPDGGPLETGRSGPTLWMVTSGGGLRITFTAVTAAFVARGKNDRPSAVVFAVPETSRPNVRTTLTMVGPDRDALRVDRRGDQLVDLGLGQPVAFCVRTGDPDLLDALRMHEGASWRSALPAMGPALVAASPDRVLCGPLGRAEIYNPIPPPHGRSPTGSHTHLIPDRLAGQHGLGEGQHGFRAVPPPGWCPALTAWVARADPSTKARIIP
jgi:hypothetical protein